MGALLDLNDVAHGHPLAMEELKALDAKIKELEKKNRILEIKNSGTLANNLCPDHRDKQQGKLCLACRIEQLQSDLNRTKTGYNEYQYRADKKIKELTASRLEECRQCPDLRHWREGWEERNVRVKELQSDLKSQMALTRLLLRRCSG